MEENKEEPKEEKKKKKKKKKSSKKKVAKKEYDPYDDELPIYVPHLTDEEIMKILEDGPSLEYFEKHPEQRKIWEDEQLKKIGKLDYPELPPDVDG